MQDYVMYLADLFDYPHSIIPLLSKLLSFFSLIISEMVQISESENFQFSNFCENVVNVCG